MSQQAPEHPGVRIGYTILLWNNVRNYVHFNFHILKLIVR